MRSFVLMSVCVGATLIQARSAFACNGTLAELRAALPADARAQVIDTTAHVLSAELDGRTPREGVLSFDVIPAPGSTNEPGRSEVFVFACTNNAWRVLGHIPIEIDSLWDGFYEGPIGVRVLRAEKIAGLRQSFLRVEHRSTRGGADPRFDTWTLRLIHVVGVELVVAFEATTSSQTVMGPEREGPTETTRVRMVPGRVPRIETRTFTDDGNRNRPRCQARHVFDGRVFVSNSDTCR